MEKDQTEREVIKHFSHPHPLVLNEDQSDETKEACCNGCLEPLFGPCFSCGDCSQFHLHKKCAQAPLQITHSPFHSKHPTLTLKSSINIWCDLCKEDRDMFSYWCSSDDCYACLDIKCAFLLHNIDGNFHELKYIGHQHPLTFFENPIDELKTASCYWCQKPLIDCVYVCPDCKFYLHKKCAQLPTQLTHPSHRKHRLFIENGRFVCKLCERDDWSLFYCCLPCKFDIDIKCVMSKASCPTTVEDKSHHEHPFTRLLRDGSFVCDACGTEGNYISYNCSPCHIMIHEKCISLPRFIKITRHHHSMIHNYFFQKKELESHGCGICLSEVKAEYGSYSCLKQDCNYVVHVNCAIEDEDLFRVIDQDEAADEENSKSVESSITDIMEVNEHGDAVKIKHFSHQHCLMLGGKISGHDDDDGKQCDGCVGSILDSFFYYCRECDFILHKACAELPRRKLLWFHQSLTTLNLGGIFRCQKCDRLCSGFFYEGRHSYWDKFCVRCAIISHTLRCEGHEHSLFFDFKFRGKCNGCGGKCRDGAYKCKDCPFALNFACITLPKATGHKSDEHIFKLAFHDRMDDESEEYYCHICEEKRDPNLWFYYCAVCDNSAHPKCALGKYPFIKKKTGTPFYLALCRRCHRRLIFVKALYDTCSECHRPCVDVALKCRDPECNYIIHLDHC